MTDRCDNRNRRLLHLQCASLEMNTHMKRLSHTHTHTTVLLLFWNMSRTTRMSRYQKGKTRKVKTNLDLLEQEIVSGSSICWAICKSAPQKSQTTMPTSHHSVFYRLDALPVAQPTASKHWRQKIKPLTQDNQCNSYALNCYPSVF